MRYLTKVTAVMMVGGVLSLLAGCGSGDGPMPVGAGGKDGKNLMGGGSSFAYPVMNKWSSEYYKANNVQVNYQSMGSSGGVKQFTERTLDFGATDAPMNEEQLAAVGAEVLHVPVVMGAVVITYNLPGLSEPLVLSGPVVADIYLGKITKWNDPAIAGLNPGANLPDESILTLRRSDGSGTTFIFSEFLSKTSAEWKEKVGFANSLSWPTDSLGGKGNEGLAANVQQRAHSIGYVELVYALEAKLPVASIVNAAGEAVAPSVESVTAAAAGLTDVPADLRLSITNAEGAGAYPMAGITWVVARAVMDQPQKAQSLNDFLSYVLSDEAQELVGALNYSKLPPTLLEPARKKAAALTSQPAESN